jgi:hypothetical protein
MTRFFEGARNGEVKARGGLGNVITLGQMVDGEQVLTLESLASANAANAMTASSDVLASTMASRCSTPTACLRRRFDELSNESVLYPVCQRRVGIHPVQLST